MNWRKRFGRHADRSPALLRHMWWWQRAQACPCSGRQIRYHLFMADLFAWLLIIAALAVIFLKFR